MTVSTSYAPLTYNGNDATTAFSVTWPFFASTDLVVTLVDSDGGETTKTITTHYTVSGGMDSDGLPATGTVTMLTAPATGQTLRIQRNTGKTQSAEWYNGYSFQAKTIESAFDRLTLIAQESGSGIGGGGALIDGTSLVFESTGDDPDYWDARDEIIRNVADPVEDDDAATKGYGDTYWGGAAATTAVAAAAAAASSATSASTSASNAATSWDAFDDLYLGAKAAEPSVDNDGDALQDGALYWNTTTRDLWAYDLGTTTWYTVALSVTDEGRDFILGDSETPTGDLDSGSGSPRIYRLTDRVFGGDAASFSGHYSVGSMTGIDAESTAIHPWAWRDAELLWSSLAGAMAIVGTSVSSNRTNWPYIGSSYPASIGVSGFAVNDVGDSNGQCWGGYFDAVRYAGSGFTVGIETTCANIGTETTLTPYNYLTGGAQGGASQWIASGAGLDRVSGSDWESVNSIAAFQVYLTSFTQGSPGTWTTATSYSVGDLVYSQTEPPIVFRCRTAHTSGGGTFAADRVAHSTYWEQRPGAVKGRVVTTGAVKENSPGAMVFIVEEMPERHMYAWRRRDAPKTGSELSAYIWCDNRTPGSGSIGLTFNNDGAMFDSDILSELSQDSATSIIVTNTNAGSSATARLALTADHGTFELYNSSTVAGAYVYAKAPSAGGVYFDFAGVFRFRSDVGSPYVSIGSTGINLTTGLTYQVNATTVLGSRKTGWTAASGTATRSTFDTSTVTTAQLAERVKALIDDFISHGAIGA